MSLQTHPERPSGWSRRLALSVTYLAAIAILGFALAIFLLAKDSAANAVGAFVGVTWAVPVSALAITIAAAVGVGRNPHLARSRGRLAGFATLALTAVGATIVGVALTASSGWRAIGAALPCVALILTARAAPHQIREGLGQR
jgi:hypothetical protein